MLSGKVLKKYRESIIMNTKTKALNKKEVGKEYSVCIGTGQYPEYYEVYLKSDQYATDE